MAWRLAKSLEQLRAQVNAAYPKRSKVSDGTIGDEAHASRSSDHNPWVKDGDVGIVTGLDLTHDPKNGLDIQKLADALLASKDSRIKYIICNGRIASGSGQTTKAWAWRPYNGKNKHNKHIHISVKSSKAQYDSVAPWAAVASAGVSVQPAPAPVKPSGYTDKAHVAIVQHRLDELGYNTGSKRADGTFDGVLGKLTAQAILASKQENDFKPLDDAITDAYLTALDDFKKRDLPRQDLTPAEVRQRAPEVQTSFIQKNTGTLLAGAGVIGGLYKSAMEALGEARGYVEPLLAAVPWWVWVGGVLGAGGYLFYQGRRGERAGTEAFKNGGR